MIELSSFRLITQQPKSNDCWLACAAMIANYYHPGLNATVEGIRRNHHIKPGVDGSAPKLLITINGGLWCSENIPVENYAIPTFEEIAEEIIKQKKPLLCLVSTERRTTKLNDPNAAGRASRDLTATNGHWIVLVGVDTDTRELLVADPAEEDKQQVKYDPLRYTASLYWQNTTYIDPPCQYTLY